MTRLVTELKEVIIVFIIYFYFLLFTLMPLTIKKDYILQLKQFNLWCEILNFFPPLAIMSIRFFFSKSFLIR